MFWDVQWGETARAPTIPATMRGMTIAAEFEIRLATSEGMVQKDAREDTPAMAAAAVCRSSAILVF